MKKTGLLLRRLLDLPLDHRLALEVHRAHLDQSSGASHVILPQTALYDTKAAKPVNLRLAAGEINAVEAHREIRVPAFWSSIFNPHQWQHALASMSDKTINQDFANSDPKDFPIGAQPDFWHLAVDSNRRHSRWQRERHCSGQLCGPYAQPTFDQPPQFTAPPVPKQQPAYVSPTSKMTSSAPALIPSSRLVPTSLTAPLPQPPLLPWQTECIRNPVPLEQLRDFLATDTDQQAAPEEQSTLAHAVAREMDAQKAGDHIQQQSWHQMEVEKRRRTMAQPAWKTAKKAQLGNPFPSQPSTPAYRPPPTSSHWQRCMKHQMMQKLFLQCFRSHRHQTQTAKHGKLGVTSRRAIAEDEPVRSHLVFVSPGCEAAQTCNLAFGMFLAFAKERILRS